MLPIKRVMKQGWTVTGSLPDIDTDLSARNRPLLFNYLQKKHPQIARVGTITYAKARSSVRYAAKALGVADNIVSPFVKEHIDLTTDLSESVSKPEVKKAIEKYRLEKVIKLALKFEGLVSHYGVHAAAVVISPYPISGLVPVVRNKDNPELSVTMYDMHGCEDIGLIKYDFLGLANIDVIHDTASSVGINIKDIPLDDPEVYKFLSSGEETFGIFQLEKGLTRKIMEAAKVSSIEDISAINAIIRPGPLDSGFHKDYIEGSKKHKIKAVNRILRDTRGILLYQEQLIDLAVELGRFTPDQADDFRKAIGKKDPSKYVPYKEPFMEAALEQGYEKEDIEEVWQWFEAAGRYAFNKSHSVQYSIISYYCAYLRHYYPAEYFAAYCNAYVHDTDKLFESVKRIKKMGFEFLPPDINLSGAEFKAENGKIRFGFRSVKEIGPKVSDKIVKVRNGSRWNTVEEFRADKTCSARQATKLAMAGAFDNICTSRNAAIYILEYIKPGPKKGTHRNQDALFDDIKVVNVSGVEPETSLKRGEMEKEVVGIYMTKNPLEKYTEFTNGEHFLLSDLDSSQINEKVSFCAVISQFEEKRSKSKGTDYVQMILADQYEEIQAMAFERDLPAIKKYLSHRGPVIVSGYLKPDSVGEDDDSSDNIFKECKVFVNNIRPMGTSRNNQVVLKFHKGSKKEEVKKALEFLKKHENQDGSNIALTYFDKTGKIKRFDLPYKVSLKEATRLYLNRNYGIVFEVEE